MQRIRQAIRSLETADLPLSHYLLTFLFITLLRNFLELMSLHQGIRQIDMVTLLHYTLFYLAILLSFVLLFRQVLKLPIPNLFKLMVPSFTILLLPPIADLLITGGKGFHMSYILPGAHGDLLERYFTYFGEYRNNGVSPGIKLEIALVLTGSAIYSWFKRKQWWRSLILVVAMYSIFFLYGIAPYILTWLFAAFSIKLGYAYSEWLFPYYFIMLIVGQGLLLAALHSGSVFMNFVRDIRPLRVLHYLLMVVFGSVYAFGYVDEFTWLPEHYFQYGLILCSIVFAILYSIITNNVTDLAIDSVSNTNRPLVTDAIDRDTYKALETPFLVIAMLLAAAVNVTTLFLVLLFIGNYYIYSMPPLRLKRVPILSKAFIALNSVIFVMLGYYFITGDVTGFPKSFLLHFIVMFTLGANFIDLKDYDGDKAAGIPTLPVLLGLPLAKIIIGATIALAYGYAYWLIQRKWQIDPWLLWPTIALAIAQFLVIIRKNYQEKWVFFLYLATIFGLVAYWATNDIQLKPELFP